jgi:hypothetical protein
MRRISPVEIPARRINVFIAPRCLDSSTNGSSFDPWTATLPGNKPWTTFCLANANLFLFAVKKRGFGMPVNVVLDSRITNFDTYG